MEELAVTYAYIIHIHIHTHTHIYIYTHNIYIYIHIYTHNLVTWMDIHGFPRSGIEGPWWTIRGARLQLRPGTLLGWQGFREEREQIERGQDVHLGNFLRGDLDLDISWFHGSIYGHLCDIHVTYMTSPRTPSGAFLDEMNITMDQDTQENFEGISGYTKIFIWDEYQDTQGIYIYIYMVEYTLSLALKTLVSWQGCSSEPAVGTCPNDPVTISDGLRENRKPIV